MEAAFLKPLGRVKRAKQPCVLCGMLKTQPETVPCEVGRRRVLPRISREKGRIIRF